jgi:hypothetical protein
VVLVVHSGTSSIAQPGNLTGEHVGRAAGDQRVPPVLYAGQLRMSDIDDDLGP